MLMVYSLVADTWGNTCIIATTRVVVLAEFILSQRLSQTCPSIAGLPISSETKAFLKNHLIISLISYLTFSMDKRT